VKITSIQPNNVTTKNLTTATFYTSFHYSESFKTTKKNDYQSAQASENTLIYTSNHIDFSNSPSYFETKTNSYIETTTINKNLTTKSTNQVTQTKMQTKSELSSFEFTTSTLTSKTQLPDESYQIYSCTFDESLYLNSRVCGIYNVFQSNTTGKFNIITSFKIPNSFYIITDVSSFSLTFNIIF
jgi:hypothetical protein